MKLGCMIALWGVMLVGCAKKKPAPIPGVNLAQADGMIPVPSVPEVLMRLPEDLTAPLGDPVYIAADAKAKAGQVLRSMQAVEESGRRAVLLVRGRRGKLGRLPDPVKRADEVLRLWTTDDDVRACVSPPGVVEASCVSRLDKMHIDRAYVRELVRKAMAAYKIGAVHVEIAQGLEWADAVRAIDGARTCCKETFEVSLELRTPGSSTVKERF